MEMILIFFACYLALAVVTNGLAVRYRRNLVSVVKKAKKVQGLSKHELAVLDSYVLSMRSLRTSIILFLIFVQMLLMPKEQILSFSETQPPKEILWDSGYLPEILDMHLASAACANPIFGALAYAANWAVGYRFKRLFGDVGQERELRSVSARYASC